MVTFPGADAKVSKKDEGLLRTCTGMLGAVITGTERNVLKMVLLFKSVLCRAKENVRK